MKLITRLLALSLAVFLAFTPLPLNSWGNEGHMAVNRAAARAIPASMPVFLRQAVSRIAYLGPEPDRWRSKTELELKQSQEPDHFIDLERLQGFGELPPGRYDFYKRAYERYFAAKKAATSDAENTAAENLLPDKIGLQPYITMEIFGRLKSALREYRRLQIAKQPTAGSEHAAIFYAGWLGHYVADAAQPLHTTIHYDGWVGDNPNGYTTQKGIHWKFESEFVLTNLPKLQFADRVHGPVKLEHPFQNYMQYLNESNALVTRLYELDKVHAFDGAGTPDGLEFTRQRLAAGAQMLLNLWYTAWLESADLTAGAPPPKPAKSNKP